MWQIIIEWLDVLVATAIIGPIVAWLAGFLNPYFWPPAQARLALKNFKNSWSDDPQRPEDSFRIVLCWLKDDSGKDGEIVARAFTGVYGIELVRSGRGVAALGAGDDWLPAMQQSALAVMEEWHADLAIVGRVKKSGESLSLWFVPHSGEGTLDRGDRPYTLEDVTLGADFHDDLHSQLTATALVEVAPLANTEVRGQVLKKGLEDTAEKLSSLLKVSTIGDSEHRAALHAARGNALATLGERESGTERLEQAVQAYRAALEVHTRERVPLDWATTQNNLGNALAILGERESDTERLEQAVQAYRAALEVHTRELVPLQWATTQNNLGNALQTLGERESGTERLEQAVQAYRAALEVRTRKRVPLDWAATQNNLGNALVRLGERESGTARLEQAVQAYRAALEVHTRERVPLDWAGTQNNLGAALATLGERESGTARLEQAVQAYRAALEVRTRERVPLDWAATQNNLGAALATLGERESGTARLEQAVQAYRAALEVRTRERVPLDWAATQNNLGVALAILGERESGTARLKQAAQAYRAALEVFTVEDLPRYHNFAQYDLENTLLRMQARRAETGPVAAPN